MLLRDSPNVDILILLFSESEGYTISFTRVFHGHSQLNFDVCPWGIIDKMFLVSIFHFLFPTANDFDPDVSTVDNVMIPHSIKVHLTIISAVFITDINLHLKPNRFRLQGANIQ